LIFAEVSSEGGLTRRESLPAACFHRMPLHAAALPAACFHRVLRYGAAPPESR